MVVRSETLRLRLRITVDVVEGAEWREHLEKGEAVFEAGIFYGGSRKDDHNRSDLFQYHLPQCSFRGIHRRRRCHLLLLLILLLKLRHYSLYSDAFPFFQIGSLPSKLRLRLRYGNPRLQSPERGNLLPSTTSSLRV